MKELKHDIESYIITIRRKGQQDTAPQTVASGSKRPVQLIHESGNAHEPQALNDPQVEYGSLEITAPLPGIIVGIRVRVGDTVSEGQELAVLEPMKMENSIESPRSGTVRTVNVSIGDTVSEGTVIMTIK